eukprot:CAMPEP_0117026504 /NCGR_PEP_ID=MMETSP0472-20121206/19477_1 /TAXON_ID=693140 ORGANISM="Tiarina fusus, Strain LIS" /NCGR_SAMPLE_ID=MMETSP0472 /ASSEMBLY_ACC=CAM_ASM_000603 /LENGTH=211 /DNA_ID=CAMNT_0004733525 /DNA_START=60 /DNA_END=695 /DNA_ORIENTATION=-
MKIHHHFVVLLALALVGTVSALPELDGEEDDCPQVKLAREEEEEEELLAAELAARAAEAAKEPYPEQCLPYLAECEEQVASRIALIEKEMGMISERLEPTKKAGDDAMALTEEIKLEIAQLEKEAEEAKKSEAMAKGDLGPTKQQIADAEEALASCTSATESRVLGMEAQIAALKAEAAEFASSRIIFDIDNIKSGAKGVLKKYGLVKDEL